MKYEIMFRLAPQKQEGLFQGMNWVHYCCQVCLDAQVSEHSSFISLTAFDTEKDRPSNIAGSHTLSVQISRDSFHVSQVRRQFFFFFFFFLREDAIHQGDGRNEQQMREPQVVSGDMFPPENFEN